MILLVMSFQLACARSIDSITNNCIKAPDAYNYTLILYNNVTEFFRLSDDKTALRLMQFKTTKECVTLCDSLSKEKNYYSKKRMYIKLNENMGEFNNVRGVFRIISNNGQLCMPGNVPDNPYFSFSGYYFPTLKYLQTKEYGIEANYLLINCNEQLAATIENKDIEIYLAFKCSSTGNPVLSYQYPIYGNRNATYKMPSTQNVVLCIVDPDSNEILVEKN